jgi:tetratricopeptide (TPR) repeat protein
MHWQLMPSLASDVMSPAAGPIARCTTALRDTPVTIPALGALVLFVAWSGNQAGYPVTHWAPGALIVLALLAIAISSAPPRLREIALEVRIALTCLALFTALSYLSILWAAVPGDAWDGANRTLLYLFVFALFSLWRQRGASAALLLGAWTLAMIALAAFVTLHVDGAAHPVGLFSEGRLKYPADYENAAAATWGIALWPALMLAACKRVHWALRGVLAGGTVLLADLALLSESRGSLFASVAMLAIVFGLLPGRVRTFVAFVPIAIGVGVTTPILLRVNDRLLHGGDVKAALHDATAAMFAAALLVGLLVALAGAIERRRVFSAASVKRIRTGVAATAIVTLVAVLVGGWVAAGDPVARVEHGWNTFKGGYEADNAHVNRLISGLGSGRYDFYRVALDEFSAHPLVGIGADNFQQQYLAHGRFERSPRYPHSVELRTLADTGLLGALLAIAGLGAALLAAARACRSPLTRADPLARGVAVAALAGFAYWLVHGSFDWFWEFPGLGAPAFALLGLTCSLAPSRRSATADASDARASVPPAGRAGSATGGRSAGTPSRRRPIGDRRALARRPAVVGAVALALAAVASLGAPWLSELQVQSAARIWTEAPRKAYSDLEDAARLNPLSDEAYLVAGSIALRYGDLVRADRDFSRALARSPGDAYATLELGAIASARGDRAAALRELERAVKLDPRDELTRETLSLVRSGERVNIGKLNRSILSKAQRLS